MLLFMCFCLLSSKRTHLQNCDLSSLLFQWNMGSFSDDFQIDDYFLFAQLFYIGALKLEASVVKVKVSSCVA